MMGSLLLIRHGQAIYDAGGADRLTPLGERQARRVGARLAREAPRVSRVVCGPRRRHRQTADILIDQARTDGADYPTAIEEPFLDELPVRELLHAAPPLPGESLLDAVSSRIERWLARSLSPAGVESPNLFVMRVTEVFERLAPPEGEVSILVTSGGPIAVPLWRAGALGDARSALTTALQLSNASVTELVIDDGDWKITSGHPVAHLSDDEITKV